MPYIFRLLKLLQEVWLCLNGRRIAADSEYTAASTIVCSLDPKRDNTTVR